MTESLAALRDRLPALLLRDERRLARRLAARDADLAALRREVDAAERRVSARRSAVPQVNYPPQLPVSDRVDDIAAALTEHQVVVVAGETGSGKTTQLPKICLALGRGVRGAIAHTQPRRIAARAVAERLAEELEVPLGEAVGYQVRFTRQASHRSLVKVMTDGVLLAEIGRDPDLLAYDTVVVDEAHERSLTIDFLLGYLARLLPRRPDLRVIVTSATIDPARFAEHFSGVVAGVPVVEVSGRTYPVEVRYRPWDDDTDIDRDQTQAVIDALRELANEGPGDALVFLSGEREIRDTAEALRKVVRAGTEVLPLFGRLSAAEQHRVFAPHDGRRIVLATNVAETSLTVPGIRYVVDTGTARISRYSTRLKVQRLPIEKISQASARQRAGRCGRVADGICIRLYSQDDHDARPAYTDPEILRTNLAAVILQMAALDLGPIEDFPFLDPPDRRAVRDGVALLEELGALARTDGGTRLTELGRRLSRLPLDPRLGRMVLAAAELGCLLDVLVVTAGLTIQDPRERPADAQEQADAAHRRFADESSDVIAWLNLWRYLEEQQSTLSSSAFRRMCRSEHLHYLRIREWQDLVAQLRDVVTRDLGLHVGDLGAHRDHVHRALLTGLLSHVGLRANDGRGYLGARGAKFVLWPGSSLAAKPPRWVMAAELVETSRLFARAVAAIDPQWIEQAGAHLLSRSYSEPHWDARRGVAMGYERVSLYGIPVVARRRVSWAGVDADLTRELFIRHALVEGEWSAHHRFLARNRDVAADARSLEDKLRRRDVVDDDALYRFYDERVPATAVSGRHFDSWWKTTRRTDPGRLDLTLDDLAPPSTDVAGLPDTLHGGDAELPLAYRFDPGADDDGATAQLPLALLNRVSAAAFSWHVPAHRHELAVAFIRGLPKELRRALVPAPEAAVAALAEMRYDERTSFADALRAALLRVRGVVVPPSSWVGLDLPSYLRLHIAVIGPDGAVLAFGDDLGQLREQLAPQLSRVLAGAAPSLTREGLQAWPGGRLPTTVEVEQDGAVVVGHPALVDTGDSVAVRVLPSAPEQQAAMRTGTRRLLLLTIPSPARAVLDALAARDKLALARDTDGRAADAVRDAIAASVDALVDDCGGPAWDEASFARLRDYVAQRLAGRSSEVLRRLAEVHALAHDLRQALAIAPPAAMRPAYDDLRAQLADLVPADVASESGEARLPHLIRYLQAIRQRLERLPRDIGRDLTLMQRVHAVEDAWHQALDELPPSADVPTALAEVKWMLEELRVSLFAQQLGTAHPVSGKRILQVVHSRA